ncbi:MAG: hypothetical protein GWN99_09955 [Gemmatimonadetes bacterium]|uniref:Uncharacterized protein n=1 Tax=Candidatus Kutchimonas denitrificans TaxID=3056748 RepID=A0AAE4Z5R4_9BACT|nr:hypothetical protein [Gemmatimonadota bacterium]NIR74315.1 hypothetical protein [Candidatus Kutchimonas denitrificans]NIS01371.1 hypothetical protein [Gemmatimonadota bacterium]NIT67111.1 hypothetical protein [Gemmatimonadota bacterium]NIU52767.1 hypothetical protein [Gemmatimonadota bacterium]
MRKHLFRAAALVGLVGLACSDGLEPVPFQGISGTVSFVGEVPDSTDWVRLVAYRDLPQQPLDLLGFAAFSDTLPLGVQNPEFILGLDAARYAWLPIVWKRQDAPLSPEALRVIGWYTGGSGPFDPPQPIEVETNAETGDLTVTGDFGQLLTAEEALEAIR